MLLLKGLKLIWKKSFGLYFEDALKRFNDEVRRLLKTFYGTVKEKFYNIRWKKIPNDEEENICESVTSESNETKEKKYDFTLRKTSENDANESYLPGNHVTESKNNTSKVSIKDINEHPVTVRDVNTCDVSAIDNERTELTGNYVNEDNTTGSSMVRSSVAGSDDISDIEEQEGTTVMDNEAKDINEQYDSVESISKS